MGYVVLPQLVPPELVIAVRDSLLQATAPARPCKVPLFIAGAGPLGLLVHPPLLSLCRQFCGPYYRLDHAFMRCQPSSDRGPVVNLHGGPQSGNGSHLFVQQGQATYCGQLAVGFPCSPQGGDAGGLVFLPGSHKSWQSAEGRDVLRDCFEGQVRSPLLDCPQLQPGDAVVFSEGCIHGASAIEGSREVLYFMFTPGHVAYAPSPLPLAIRQAAAEYGLAGLCDPACVTRTSSADTAQTDVRREPTPEFKQGG